MPSRERARRSTAAMAHDPFTIHVALDAEQVRAEPPCGRGVSY